MAIFHMSGQIITRSKGHSSVKAAAYRHGAAFYDERTGEKHDFTKKGRVDDTIILLPDGADERFKNPEYLWNTVEKEKRKDAQLSREFNMALPTELTPEENKALAIEYCQKNFVDKGMIADIAFHKLDTDNPHFHVMLTMRNLSPDGNSFGNKNRDWNDKEQIENWRKDWAETTNQHLEKAGIDARIDHRSLHDQRKELLAIDNPSAEQQKQIDELDRSPGQHKGKSFHTDKKVKASLSDDTPSLKPSPPPSPASMDASSKGGVIESTAEAISSVSSKAASAVKPTNQDTPEAPEPEDMDDDDEYEEYELPEKEKEPKKGKDKKQSSGVYKGDGGAKSLSDYRDSHDKNLHLTEAQREELEELEAAEEQARKAYLTKSVDVPESEEQQKSSYYDKTLEERDSNFKSKFKSALNQKRSFTEQQFEEERKRYENKGHPKYK